MITKNKLEELAKKYEVVGFIKNDPIQFAHRFLDVIARQKLSALDKSSPEAISPNIEIKDVEIAAFVCSLFAYGNREVFIKKLDKLFEIMQNKPLDFVLNFNPNKLAGFNYRFAKDSDIIEVFRILNKLYSKDGGLKKLFEYGYSLPSPFGSDITNIITLPRPLRERVGVRGEIYSMLQAVVDYFYSNVKKDAGAGFYHLIPNPQNGGAMKRMNLFLRWMVRKSPVDLGIWDFISPSELLIPLDVHVARLSREMGLLYRSSNDAKAVIELTQNLKKIDQNDPVKFDFAIFGLGIDNKK